MSLLTGRPSLQQAAIWGFIGAAIGLAWLVTLPLWAGTEGLASPMVALLLPVMMLTPAIATGVALLVQKPRPRSIPSHLGLWPIRPVGRIVWVSLASIPAAVLLVATGVGISSWLGFVELDLVTFSGYTAVLQQAGIHDLALPVGALVTLQLVALPLNAVMNIPFALGEEIGWRGWLLPALTPLGTWPALILSGVVWGLWHTPIILLGYNFSRPGLDGVLMMTVACTIFGVLLGWLRLRTGSIWPPTVAHAAFNASAGLLSLVVAAGPVPDPATVGPLGWVAWIPMIVLIGVLIVFRQVRKEKLTAHRERERLVDGKTPPDLAPIGDDISVAHIHPGGRRS